MQSDEKNKALIKEWQEIKNNNSERHAIAESARMMRLNINRYSAFFYIPPELDSTLVVEIT